MPWRSPRWQCELEAFFAEAAVFFGNIDTEEVRLGHGFHDIRGELVLFIQFCPHRHDLLNRDLPCEIAYHDLVLCQQIVHSNLRITVKFLYKYMNPDKFYC
jgi:hypothetical protein